jgi:hypothetical protein
MQTLMRWKNSYRYSIFQLVWLFVGTGDFNYILISYAIALPAYVRFLSRSNESLAWYTQKQHVETPKAFI